MEIKDGVKKQLDSDIPKSAVTTREAWRGGPKLSYLTGAYVINRMNEVIGQGNWGYDLRNLQLVFEGEIEQGNGKAFTTSYVSTITLWADIDGKKTAFTEVGYGDGTDKKSKGKAHELATKEAVTDATKRAAKNLGISMGLGLYFKGEEYVEDTANEPAKQQANTKPIETPQPSSGADAPKTAQSGQKNNKNAGANTEKITKQQIKESFAVLQSLKKIDKDSFVQKYLKGGKTDSLDEPTAIAVLSQMKQDFPDVKL